MNRRVGFIGAMPVALALPGALGTAPTRVLATQPAPLAVAAAVDPGCETHQAWTVQGNPRADLLDAHNVYFPDVNATYWVTELTAAAGTTVTVYGRFPLARHMSIQVYDANRRIVDSIHDAELDPDPGQNNPYRSGSAQGTYTAQLVFGTKPASDVPPNTIYTDGETSVALMYRVYYPNSPDNLPATFMDPTRPDLQAGDVTLSSCPPRPVVLPEDQTVWGRLDNGDFTGSRPAQSPTPVNPPRWSLTNPNETPGVFANEDNSYMSAAVSRDYLQAPYNYELLVLRLKPPTHPNTQAGTPAYVPAQVRYWSVCQNEPTLTSVVRCLPDNAHITRGGLATVVFSDPSKRPADSVLNEWGARWLPWGALQPDDIVYNLGGDPLTNEDGVFYNGLVLYRQTMADPAFAQSIENVSRLPVVRQKRAMGAYWPTIGYCTRATFQSSGPGCVGPR